MVSTKARVPMIDNSIFVKSIIIFVHAISSICDHFDSYFKACYQDAWIMRLRLGVGRRFRKEAIKASVFVRIAEEFLGPLTERVNAVLVSAYEGSRVLNALELALANSKLIR